MFNWLLVFVPAAIALEHLAPERYLLVFLAAALAILPLAGWMSEATEKLAQKSGEGIGGLLNATFGNAAELIIAFAALRAGDSWVFPRGWKGTAEVIEKVRKVYMMVLPTQV